MNRDHGEAAWTARDLLEPVILTDAAGHIYGRFTNEGEALTRREYLIAEGIECWLVPASSLEDAAC